MKYLLDTVVFLHFLKGNRELFSPRAQRVLSDPENQYVLSVVSLWEIAIKYSLKKLDLKKAPGGWLLDIAAQMGWEVLPVLPAHALQVATLAYHHRDPFDRLLIAQSQTEGLPVITPDDKFGDYDIKRVW